jgi:UDP-N-acetylmuramoyl-L-alanyl-D-glutamate--2,6-diaminopimelate ligase
MKLSELIQSLSFLEMHHFKEVEISGITANSKEIQPGNLFVAIGGTLSDGHQFIAEATSQGATALVVEREVPNPKKLPIFHVTNSRLALSGLACSWFGNPSQDLHVIGVTGTNGKTTITYLIEAILQEAQKKTGMIGTVQQRFDGKEIPSSHTTPESIEIHRILKEMKDHGVNDAVMEVSSHAVEMRRVEHVMFDSVIFTNLTPEHLDYHKSMELYFEAKKRLFTQLLPKGKGTHRAILNAEDRYSLKLVDILKNHPVWTYSTQPQSKWDFFVQNWQSSLEGMKATIATPAGIIEISSRLIGSFNLSNILAAIAAAVNFEIPLSVITAAIEKFSGVPGRLEKIENTLGIHILVDYAHTPDALKNVLKTIKDLDPSRILTVFGCGGDRDRSKRPIMGREVARLSNIAILTNDNPRTENPQLIVQEILPGIEEGGMKLGHDCFIELDRKKSIELAIQKAQPGDVVLIAGKGHENYQILGTEKLHFDDREVAREILEEGEG